MKCLCNMSDTRFHQYNTAAPDRYELLKGFAERMRKFPTEAEAYLWNYISARKMGIKFNRQHIIGDFIVDFVSLKYKIVIEVDGGYHYEEEQIISDEERTHCLNRMGFEVIRFGNDEVLTEIDTVLDKIQSAIEKTLKRINELPSSNPSL